MSFGLAGMDPEMRVRIHLIGIIHRFRVGPGAYARSHALPINRTAPNVEYAQAIIAAVFCSRPFGVCQSRGISAGSRFNAGAKVCCDAAVPGVRLARQDSVAACCFRPDLH